MKLSWPRSWGAEASRHQRVTPEQCGAAGGAKCLVHELRGSLPQRNFVRRASAPGPDPLWL